MTGFSPEQTLDTEDPQRCNCQQKISGCQRSRSVLVVPFLQPPPMNLVKKRINCHHRFRKFQRSRLDPCDNISMKNSTFFSQGETTTNVGTTDLNKGFSKKQWATTEQQIAQKAYEPG